MKKSSPADNASISQNRRKLILAGASTLGLVACTQNRVVSGALCAVIPEETQGPYPANGTGMQMGGRPPMPPQGGQPPQGQPPAPPQGQPPKALNAQGELPNFLAKTDKVRSDLTKSSTGKVATGVPMTVELTLVSASGGCSALAGYALYAWHCTDDGNYSMYSDGLKDEDFLRGVGVADAKGVVRFKSILPGCYAGRWPHIHFEIYPSLAAATTGENKVKTSQLALPEDICRAVYTNYASQYKNSLKHLNEISLEKDNVFSDGVDLQMATVTGNEKDGYLVKLTVAI